MPRWNPGDEQDPTNLPDAEEAPIIEPPAGSLITFTQSASRNVVVAPAAVPGAVELAFQSPSYLDDLLSLAFRYVRAPGAATGPSPVALAIRLAQPFDKLVQPAFHDRATAPVHQSRIAVEVLRKALDTAVLTPGQFPNSLAEEVVETTASSEAAPHVAANLNDTLSATKWTATTAAAWARYRLAQPARVATYRLQSTSDAARTGDPRDWQLQGSNDGLSWSTLDQQTGQAFTTANQVRNYTIAGGSAPWRYFRINVTLTQGGAAAQLGNWFLFVADSGPTLPPQKEQRFRAMAYDAILRALGTTYVELRGARTAGSGTRKGLADRLGLELGHARPDRLDDITVSPEQITDAQLEQLFGYRSTQAGDPMQAQPLVPEVLAGLRSGLRTVWRRKDVTERDLGVLPVVDPDLVAQHNVRTGAALELWSARKALVDTEFGGILAQLEASAGTLQGFDNVFQTQLPGPVLDFTALAAEDESGEDITAALAPSGLTLRAFRHVLGIRTVYPASTPLTGELQDVAGILVQARKIALRYPQWRDEERTLGIVLAPQAFAPDPVGTVAVPPPWRGEQSTVDRWHATLETRTRQNEALETNYRLAVEAAENTVLPQLRDALLEEIGAPLGLSAGQVADRLTRELCVDFRAAGAQRVDRVTQAVDTMQSLLVSVRSGVFANFPDAQARLSIPANENAFDVEWAWLESYPRWVSAMRTFAHPESQLQPHLFRAEGPIAPTQAYTDWYRDEIAQVRRLSPAQARTKAATYLQKLRTQITTLPPALTLTDLRTSTDLAAHAAFQDQLIPGTVTDEAGIPQHVREIYWLVPMVLARKLRESRQYVAALDWYQTVFNYQAAQAGRKIYRGLTKETSIPTTYNQPADWLAALNLNPHLVARTRAGAYTRATVMSIVECVQAFADSEFARSTPDANARARALYQTAIDLLALPEMVPPATPPSPFPANPVPVALRASAESGLAKISAGFNIGGSPEPNSFLPSQYRYAAVIDRAKALVATAQQVESAYFSALERVDTENYNLLRAGHDLRVAAATVDIHHVKVAGAEVGMRLADVQRQKAQDFTDEMSRRISAGLNEFEAKQLSRMRNAIGLQDAGGMVNIIGGAIASFTNPVSAIGGLFGAMGAGMQHMAQLENARAQIDGIQADHARRAEDWALQRNQANRDVEIGMQQIALAANQRQLAVLERGVAQLNQEHAQAVMNFLSNKFTNAELHEWMSGVLGRVYDYFLQQATAMARLAQAQLAFERQEPPVGFIAADYWQEATAELGEPGEDRRGLTGSARLLQDITRLDQHAFQTDRRRLELRQTFPLSRVAGYELEQLRQTGVLTFATPQELFDRDFPGHYLRLIKRVEVSIIALLPPTRGIRATLEASGLSRAVVPRPDAPGGTFDTVALRRDPEKIAFTAAIGANGLFALQPNDNGLLLPFEGMGVDAIWQLRLPKAANPFDFASIAEVLFTVEYTALHSDDYREEVIHRLGRRFSADRTFSLRNEFPDAWYALHNPDTVEDPAERMRATLPLKADDFPSHIEELAVRELSLFVVWRDAPAPGELTVESLTHGLATAGPVTTTEGIVTTRRDNGAAWRDLTGPEADPAGDWHVRLPDTALVRSWFTGGHIEDLVLVLGLSGRTPEWR